MNNKSKHISPWGNSLRILPWDKLNEEPTLTEELISSTVREWYDAKHREASKEEVDLINSIVIDMCPYCGSVEFIRYGYKSNGIQQYKCNSCNSKFSALTNTIFQDRKIPISETTRYFISINKPKISRIPKILRI